MELLILLLWLVLSVVAAEIASRKGRSPALWLVFALLLSPLIGILLIAVLPVNEEGLLRKGKLVKCGKCAELVRSDASICRYCGSQL